jgi:hypothetical protein
VITTKLVRAVPLTVIVYVVLAVKVPCTMTAAVHGPVWHGAVPVVVGALAEALPAVSWELITMVTLLIPLR